MFGQMPRMFKPLAIYFLIISSQRCVSGCIQFGEIGNVTNKESEKEMLDRGLSLLKERKWEQAYEVFTLAWEVYNESEVSGGVHSIEEFHIAENVQFAAYKSGRVKEAHAVCQRMLNHIALTEAQRTSVIKALQFFERHLSVLNMKEMYQRIDNATVEEKIEIAKYASSINQYKFCNDEVAIPAMKKLSENSKLFCRYDNRKRHPLLILAPLKEEILSFSPLLIIVYELTTESDINLVKEDAVKRVETGTLHSNGIDYENAHTRKVRTAQSNESSMGNILARLEAAFGLNPYVHGCLRFQVIHYGIGGHYLPHFDGRLKDADVAQGDGVASLLLYLNEVEEGGATAYPKMGIRIQPTKGAGVFWFNYHKNETADLRTIHGACPLLKGEKWVATRLFLWRGQLTYRKHGKTADEDFTLEDLNLPPEIRFRNYVKH